MRKYFARAIIRIVAYFLDLVGGFTVLCAVGLAVAIIKEWPPEVFSSRYMDLTFFGLPLLHYAWPEDVNAFMAAVTLLLMVVKLVGLAGTCLLSARLLFCVLDGRTPFTRDTARQLHRISFCLLLYLLAFGWTQGLGGLLLALVVPCIIYSLALIFEYGCQLQQQADETL